MVKPKGTGERLRRRRGPRAQNNLKDPWGGISRPPPFSYFITRPVLSCSSTASHKRRSTSELRSRVVSAMENYEDDEDTHFCNKCHSNVNGLENYVQHRQSGCQTIKNNKNRVYHSPVSTTSISYPEILNADAFFSSLELQSSAKCHPRRANDLLYGRIKKSSRSEEHKKKKRKNKNLEDKDESKEKLVNLLTVVTDLDDLGIPSLVGFPEIVASTSSSVSKPSISNVLISSKEDTRSSANSKTEYPVYFNKHETIITNQKRNQVETNKINQHQHHSVWLEDTILTDLVANNENENKDDLDEGHMNRYAEYDYHQDDGLDDDSLNMDMVEEDLYMDSEDTENHDTHYPPQNHTGGKWKPMGIVHEEIINEDDAEIDEREHYDREHPPPNHTGGKWKPNEINPQKCNEFDSKNVLSLPPPNHTRGKWVPGARTDINKGYWCSPCGRKLASQLVYNRHLLSGLHARRSIQEINGAVQMPRGSTPYMHRKNLSQRQKIVISVNDTFLPLTEIVCSQKQSSNVSGVASESMPVMGAASHHQIQKKRLRSREKEVLSCEMCHARVRKAQMGKHLLSYYHCRVAGANPSSMKARRFLLENMANIVRQCPFQCASCRFYCNTEDTFLRHWRSDAHKGTISKIAGSFICVLCNFWCDDNKSVESHITKQGHQNVVSMINGSVPIIIRCQRILMCSTCCRRFRYNIQLRFHAKDTGHEVDHSASDEYQCRLTCNVCGQVVRSLISLQRHQLALHKPAKEGVNIASPYFCSFCLLKFRTARQAVLHRRTSSHKETVKRRKAGDVPKSFIQCPHCKETHSELVEHKYHLLSKHPELCHRCLKCGKHFALSQDVTKHTRENQCSRDEKSLYKNSNTNNWKCPICQFTSDSEAEYLFHKALHEGLVKCDSLVVEYGSTSTHKFRCPLCQNVFSKSTLRDHIRRHTGERPFRCDKCIATFMRRSAARVHQKDCNGQTTTMNSRIEIIQERKYICSECSSAFHTKHTLRQHMLRHAGKQYKCGLPGCPTILRTETELKNHRKLVHETSNSNRDFRCNDCSYAAKTKNQLSRHQKRHQNVHTESNTRQYSCQYINCNFQTIINSHLKRHNRLHTGKKPYKCRHCTYASNNLENLRKHVLSTNLHPGKMVYQCKSCKSDEMFQTNFSKELRAHLLQVHSNEYLTPNDASNYIATIFYEREDTETSNTT
ncbi:PREDICTED: zinc finger protein 780B [Ceratosolen solmsi marchali]|uniref:Zinc finger protein 780B n=1 Tax=Ceratosolen solmsi marchali TaxID=326594 RepID=A0AAJ6YR53_9HYME|nr:PREDICTED: zinc finger protein 780B [Ceratosolen solmsi marchali]